MSHFEITIEHNDKTLELLSHMQYNLFCKTNRISRSILSLACVGIGTYNFSEWWGILLTAYGCYMLTSIYSSANYKAHKLAKQIRSSGESFPASRYLFEDNCMKILSISSKKQSETVAYSQIIKMGEDSSYIYLFPNTFGGYMISKESLGERTNSFRNFITHKTGKNIWSRKSLFLQLLEKLSQKNIKKDKTK